MKYSKEFTQIIEQCKNMAQIKKDVKIWLLYRRADIRFYGKFKHIPEQHRTNIVLRTLNDIRQVKNDLKSYVNGGGTQLNIF